MRTFKAFSFAAVILTASAICHASTAVYNSSSAFNAATTNLTSYTFPPPVTGDQTILVGLPYVDGPLTFAPVVNGEYNLLNDGYYGANVTYLEYASQDHDTWSIGVIGGSDALSFNLATFGVGTTLTVDVNGALAGTVTTPTDASSPFTTAFFGVTSTDPITSVTITGDSLHTVFDITGFESATATSPVPEPSSLALLASGLFSTASIVGRRKFHQA